MSNITPFNFQGSEIRLVGTADKPEWVAADIIAILYPDSKAKDKAGYLRGIPAEWKSKKRVSGRYSKEEEKSSLILFPAGSNEKESSSDTNAGELTRVYDSGGNHRLESKLHLSQCSTKESSPDTNAGESTRIYDSGEDHREESNRSLFMTSTKESSPEAGQYREMVTVTEPGLYYLIFRSDSPLAVPFQRWVFEDVLPSIRKTGGYGVLREFKHPLLTLPEAVAVTEAVALVDDANSGPVGAIDAICDAIDPSFKRYNQDEIGTKFLDTLNGVGKYFEHRNKLADALLILPKRLENLSEHILTYIESCPNREAHWLDIAKGIPHLGDVYEIWEPQNQHRKSQLSLLIRAVCDHLESQGKGKWKGDTFHLK